MLFPPVAEFLREQDFRLESQAPRRIGGRAIVIGGPYDGNYLHWMLSWCPRILIAEMLRPDLFADPSVRFVLDPRLKEAPFLSFLSALSIDPARIVWADVFSGSSLVVEEALLVSFPDEIAFYPELISAVATRVRTGLGVVARPGVRRRIWISRQAFTSAKRRVANMDEVSPVLQTLGFEELVLEHMPVAEQIRAFAEAEIVVGVHGAGLVNMMFCQPDTPILVIEKGFNLLFNLHVHFKKIAKCSGVRYETLIASDPPRDSTEPQGFVDAHFSDVVIDPIALESAILQLLDTAEEARI